ncbi:MAG TPA: DUF4405 domain-containing protein [Candidatus Moranbacteria bacterium]|nr:DUF4405 domain-containing protein [Candidatus Moranbacteria bacterium]
MNKSKTNYIIDLLALVSFLITAISGLAIKFFMPSGVRQGRLQEFLGIQKGSWSEVHDIFGIIFLILVVVHFLLHWNWVVCMTKSVLKLGSEECANKNEEINN